MKAQRHKYYSSTKFSTLVDTESAAKARRNYFTWITIVTILFCISATYLFYKILIAPNNFNDQAQSLGNSTNSTVSDHQKNSALKFYNPIPLLAIFRQRSRKDNLESTCGKSQTAEAIPSVYIEKVFRNGFGNIESYISADLLLYYDFIINKYRPRILKLLFNEYQCKLLLVKKSEDFENFLKDLEWNKFKFYLTNLKQRNFDLTLNSFESYFALTDELNHWYNYLDRFREFLLSYEHQKIKKYSENFTKINFDKLTEETQKRLFYFAYPFKVSEKKLLEINELISECTQPLKTDFFNCSVIFYSRVILLSDVNEKILGLNVSCLENVFIFSANIIYLDDNLNLFGVNLVVIAPKWMFLKKIKVNLDGVDGRNHVNRTLYPLQPGEPGNPGGNAGDFVAIGNPDEKFLSVSANGGKGGNGQSGSKGHDGVNNTYPDPLVKKPVCLTKIQTFNNSFGEIITHYKIYSEFGCGGSGTDGGVGGVGGAGGVITLIKKNSVKITKGLNGATGMPGKGGAGGVGGRNGCFYEVLDVDDEILHRVTRVKCSVGNTLPSGQFGKDNFNTRDQIFPSVKLHLESYEYLLRYIRFAAQDFIKYSGASVLLLLKRFVEQDVCIEINRSTDLITEYKILEASNKFELYSIFIEKIKCMEDSKNVHLALKYLKAIVLGKMLILKKNLDIFFIDLRNYLNFVKRNIMETNEQTRQIQTLTYFKKKVKIKIEQVILNLKMIRTKLIALGSVSEDYNIREGQTKNVVEASEEKRILCAAIAIVDVVYFLINRNSNEMNVKYFNLTKCSPLNLINESHQKILSKSSVISTEKIIFKVLENLGNTTEQDVKEHLVKLKKALRFLKESSYLSDAGKNLLESLANELEHVIALYNFVEWENLENVFSASLIQIPSSNSSNEESEEIKLLRTRLFEVMIAVQYKLAVDVASERLPPFGNKSQLFPKVVDSNNVVAQINFWLDNLNQDVDFFCKNYERAVFDKNSAINEFYFWPNEKIQNELKSLFSGAEIELKADLINHHVSNKDFIQFLSVRLEFECRENESVCDRHLQEILYNFMIDITHSGYSYYNWKGETQIIISDKVSLNYSFKMRENKEPEIFNAVFKKCQNAEIKLSPFTTWTFRLLPINSDADFSKLAPFAYEANLRLTGTGTYMF